MSAPNPLVDYQGVAPDAPGEAAYWQGRKAHWISQGIDPIIAGELAYLNLAGRATSPETLAEAMRSDREMSARLDEVADIRLGELVEVGFAVKDDTVDWHPECGEPPWPLGSQWPAKTAYCPQCWRWWTGERAGHCSGCHQTLGSDTTFEQHRYGKYPARRRCRSTEWMRERGWWQDDKGIWRLPKPDHDPFKKEN